MAGVGRDEPQTEQPRKGCPVCRRICLCLLFLSCQGRSSPSSTVLLFWKVLKIKPRGLCMPGKKAFTNLHPIPSLFFLFLFNFYFDTSSHYVAPGWPQTHNPPVSTS
jgi:hypothetical protein